MMAFIDSVFHVIGSFISMVFEAIVAAVQLGFSVLGGLLGLVVNLGMLLVQDHIETADTVSCYHDQAVAIIIDFAYLAFFDWL